MKVRDWKSTIQDPYMPIIDWNVPRILGSEPGPPWTGRESLAMSLNLSRPQLLYLCFGCPLELSAELCFARMNWWWAHRVKRVFCNLCPCLTSLFLICSLTVSSGEAPLRHLPLHTLADSDHILLNVFTWYIWGSLCCFHSRVHPKI